MSAGEPDPHPDDGPGDRTDDVRIALDARSYTIHVGAGILSDAARFVAPILPLPAATVISDETVAPLYLDDLARALQAVDIAVDRLVLPAGEATKSIQTLETVLETLIARGVERGTTLIALGGGVIGDLTGFAASVLLRGVPFVQIPTTLLAQVDSAVGGKTGVNSRHGKNLIGSFYQPRVVLADTAVLRTLPARELRAGYGEVAKYGLIDEPAFFGWLERHGAALLAGDAHARRHAVVTCCRAKARIVSADERETGQRALLNLGHTFAHALEAETGFGDALLHGEAVAFGIVIAYRLSARLGLAPAADAERVAAHFRAAGLPTTADDLPSRTWDADVLIEHIMRDKKVRGGRPVLVLSRGIGQAFTSSDVPLDAVRAVLEDTLGARRASSQP